MTDPRIEDLGFARVDVDRARRTGDAEGLTADSLAREATSATGLPGGIAIPHDRGLAGHSDADVVLHAITDAILGAAGEGDIGQHFPPSDPQW